MNNVEKKIEFWIELWEDLISNFLRRSFGLTLYNPHILIDEIISEIEENSFKNPDNKAFFYKMLDSYYKNDNIIKTKLKPDFKILRQIYNTDRINYTLQIAKEIKELFQQGLYFDSSLDLLFGLISKDEEMTSDFVDSLNYYSQGIIVELIKKSYALDDIKKFLRNIFSNYSFSRDNYLHTDYPHGIKSENYKDNDGQFDRNRYNTDIINYLSALTTQERVYKLSHYYYKKKERALYIFAVEGLKGEIDINVGGVTFYSLGKKRYVTEGIEDLDTEDLQREQRKEKFIQAAVEVDYLMPKSSLVDAQVRLENALDLIACYFRVKTDLYVNTSNYIIVKGGRRIFSSMSRDNRNSYTKYNNSLDLSYYLENLEKINARSFLWNEGLAHEKSVLRITNALHWYRKAEQSSKQEDKMLNYWIALENLFNTGTDIKLDILNDVNKSKFHLIQETIASVEVSSLIYELGWELYNHYSSIVDHPLLDQDKIPEDIIIKAQLKPELKEKIHLKNFVDCLPEIYKCEDNLFIKDKLSFLLDLYGNPSKAKSIIEEQIHQIKNDVLMIYRFRNLIVHNAHFDNTLLPYFVWKIRDFSGDLIRAIIRNFSKNKSLSELILGLHFKREKFLQDLELGKADYFKE